MKSIYICSFMMWLLAITFLDLSQTGFADKLPVQIGAERSYTKILIEE